MRRIFLAFAIFFLGFGASQFRTLLQFSKTAIPQKRVEITREATATASMREASREEVAVVTRIIDGDTVELADGRKLRYIGIDTPELFDPRKPVECFGEEAREENKRLVDGKTVRLEKDVSETDKYGRLLRYVWIDGVMVNDWLVRQGFAHASAYPPDVKYSKQLVEAEREARENGRGLWGECPSGSNTSKASNTSSASNTNARASNCLIKGNISSSGEKIYHLPGCGSYEKTAIDEGNGEQWFCTEAEAVKAGWRKARNC